VNILFVLYGDFSSNSANPLVLYARELHLSGHSCAVAVPSRLETVDQHQSRAFRPVLFSDALAAPGSVFPDGRPADVIHACTPREVVRRFVMSYLATQPIALVMYLEDNELWISTRALGFDETTLVQHTGREISDRLPDALAHPFYYDSFIGLADAVAVIQDKLRIKVPPWVHCATVMIGVDLEFFYPRRPDPSLRTKYGVAGKDKVLVYHGGMNEFNRPSIETLCRAVGLINQQGYPCRLLRTGPVTLDFLGQLPDKTVSAICDLGVLPRQELPDLLALADVFVQPGQIDPFEDLRLPGKVPEFLAMGRPVVMPDVNIAHLFTEGLDAVLLRTGSAEEIAQKCIGLFSNPQHACEIGRAGRRLAEKYFDVRAQTSLLEDVYKTACRNFNRAMASEIWRATGEKTPVALLLARKLRLLADSGSAESEFGTCDILREHARYIERMQQRVGGLEAAIAERDFRATAAQMLSLQRQITERDGQIAALNKAVDGFLNSYSWRLTLPLRQMKSMVKRASQHMRAVWSFGRVNRSK
jgi:glycosyltransferase involved in cell wall biosynthesis